MGLQIHTYLGRFRAHSRQIFSAAFDQKQYSFAVEDRCRDARGYMAEEGRVGACQMVSHSLREMTRDPGATHFHSSRIAETIFQCTR